MAAKGKKKKEEPAPAWPDKELEAKSLKQLKEDTLALRKEVLFRRGAIKSPKQRAPGSSLTAADKTELDGMIARLERRLAATGRLAKAAE